MDEILVSSELQEEDTSELCEEKIIYENDISQWEIIFIQLLICIVVIVLISTVKILKPDLTNDILEIIKTQVNAQYELKDEAVALINKIFSLIYA